MLYTGTPRKRRRAVRYANVVHCAICMSEGISTDMVFMQNDSPGWPTVRTLVHPECKDMPHPSARPVRQRPNKSPGIIQQEPDSYNEPTNVIAITAATFATTGTTSATVAQATADPTVNVTGTAFSAACRGRVKHTSTMPAERVTTLGGATSLSFELEAPDYVAAGTLIVGVVKFPNSSSGHAVTRSTISLTVT